MRVRYALRMVLSFFFILISLVQRGIEYVFPADGS